MNWRSPKKLVFRYWVNDCGKVVLLQLAKRSVELPACPDNLFGQAGSAQRDMPACINDAGGSSESGAACDDIA